MTAQCIGCYPDLRKPRHNDVQTSAFLLRGELSNLCTLFMMQELSLKEETIVVVKPWPGRWRSTLRRVVCGAVDPEVRKVIVISLNWWLLSCYFFRPAFICVVRTMKIANWAMSPRRLVWLKPEAKRRRDRDFLAVIMHQSLLFPLWHFEPRRTYKISMF